MLNKTSSSGNRNNSIVVTSALPYSNGEIHLGHIASTYLPADIFTRFLRLKGKEVYHLCASDDFGTPVLIKAESEGKKPEEYVEQWHYRDKKDFETVGISFNAFSKTSSTTNIEFVQYVFKILQQNGHIYEKEIVQYYCENEMKFLPDRYVVGECPFCGAENQYSDLCEKCGRIPDCIINPKCAICRKKPIYKKTTHLFFKLSSFAQDLEKWLNENTSLQLDIKKYVLNWIQEGLDDWDITRDIQWGIPIPNTSNVENLRYSSTTHNNKVFYGWFDNHLCYISTLAEYLGGIDFAKTKWNNSEIYHFIGKDIVYHHYLFLPAVRLGINLEYKLPNFIPTRGHLMLENRKISKSRNWYISLEEFISSFDPDYLRFYLASIIGYSQNDINFDWDNFRDKINGELVNNLGNFINRSLSFCKKYFGVIPKPSEYSNEDNEMIDKIRITRDKVENYLSKNEIDKALREILHFTTDLNQYFQRQEPWRNPKGANTMLFIALNAVRSLAIMLEPIIPFSSERIWIQLGLGLKGSGKSVHLQTWDSAGLMVLQPGAELGEVEPLFKKIESSQVEIQKKKLEVSIQNIEK
ncbi:MAG TPA: methionine--tRNA ligase [Nitrososphaeraceae archaeon]